MTDFMVLVPAGPIQPYAFAGIGLIRSHAKLDASSLSIQENAFGYDIGGGLNIFFVHSAGDALAGLLPGRSASRTDAQAMSDAWAQRDAERAAECRRKNVGYVAGGCACGGP